MEKVFLSACLDRREELAEYARDLGKLGYQVTASCLVRDLFPGYEPADRADRATQRYLEISASRIFIGFTEGVAWLFHPLSSDRYVDLGIALSRWGSFHQPDIYLVGPVENDYHTLPEIHRCKTWAECKESLITRLRSAENLEQRAYI